MGVDYGGWEDTNTWTNSQPGYSPNPPSQTPNNGGFWTNPSNWYPYLNLALEGINTYAGYTAAKDANRKNVQLQREQQAWEERMSNTAIQRRVEDIRRAGGNPALAFTNGQSASTPSVAPATVEPNYRPEWAKGMGAASMMLQAQLDNITAQTIKTSAETQQVRANTRITEQYGSDTAAAKLKGQELTNKINDMKQDLIYNQAGTSAAQRSIVERTADQIVEMAKQQVQENQINLDALKNVASVGGIEAGKALPFIKMIISLFTDVFGKPNNTTIYLPRGK